jgi:hypothetical protein
MDESTLSIPSDELSLRPASLWKSAVVDVPPANLAKSDKLVAPGRQCHSDEPNFAEMTCLMGLPLSSFAATRRR